MDKDTFDLIDQYLADELSDKDKMDFEKQLRSSEDFRKEFTEYKASIEAVLAIPERIEMKAKALELKESANERMQSQFSKYHASQLPEEEVKEFEIRLKEDSLFAYRFEKYLKEGRNKSEAKSYRLSTYFRIGIAASFIAILSIMTWVYLGNRIDTESLVALNDVEVLRPTKAVALVNEGVIHRGIENSSDFHQLKLDGLDAYEAKKWDRAIELLNSYLDQAIPSEEETPDEINLVNLYIGRSWFEKNEIGKAIEVLRLAEQGVVEEKKYQLIIELIQWQLVLAHLKNKDVVTAKLILQKLVLAEQPLIKEYSINLLNELK